MALDNQKRMINRRKALQYTSLLVISGGVNKVIASPAVVSRQIALNIETTGLSIADGNRIIAIGFVELINHHFTGGNLHFYFNPGRDSHEDALLVHRISNEFLRDKPKFGEVIDEILAYLKGAEIIIHNAPFDLEFLDNELERHGRRPLASYVDSVVDTWAMAKEIFPGERTSLGALCDRLNLECDDGSVKGIMHCAEQVGKVYVGLLGYRALIPLNEDVSVVPC